MKISVETAIQSIAANYWTVLVVNSEGEISDLIRLTSTPTPETLTKIGKQHKGDAFACIPRSRFTESELYKKIESLVETIEWAKTDKLKPGINLADKNDDRSGRK